MANLEGLNEIASVVGLNRAFGLRAHAMSVDYGPNTRHLLIVGNLTTNLALTYWLIYGRADGILSSLVGIVVRDG
ncbi:hypothetical protein LZ30DRAFT_727682 [Colletotrichum cereale]|nr:hypothetical protein LZ30DRAFT_727682 [Colletotrichum cereale]